MVFEYYWMSALNGFSMLHIKKIFDNRIDCEYGYDNCMYNSIEVVQVSDFEVYNITAKLGMIYVYTMEYSDLFLSNECKRLLPANP